jgi:allantoinase
MAGKTEAANVFQMPLHFAISSSRVVTPTGVVAAAIVIENGTIRKLVNRSDVPPEIPIHDFGDLAISPGLIDAHVHVNEPGRTEWEGFASATRAAAAGGVTTLIDMPLNSSPVTTHVSALQAKRAAAHDQCLVDVGFYGGLIPGNKHQLRSLVDQGVFGIKAFLCDSGLDEFPGSGESELRSALEILEPLNIPLLVHAELLGVNPVSEITDRRNYGQYVDSRPAAFELAAIELLIGLCREFRSPIHIVHLATDQALPMIEAAKQEGLPLTVETCPHYLFFAREQVVDGDTRFKCAPPIRDQQNRVGLCRAVVTGLIDTIGSDHSPSLPELKRLDTGDFSKAWGGIAGLQLTLPVSWTALKEHDMTLLQLAGRLSQKPAEIFGLGNHKGKIEAGFAADVVVWQPEKQFVVRGSDLFQRHGLTPYEGCPLSGVVHQTYVRGNLVFADGQLNREPCIGKTLSRELPGSHNRFVSEGITRCLNGQSADGLKAMLETCCASTVWIARMIGGGIFKNDNEVLTRAETAWERLTEADLLEAFSAHPRIGDVDSLREKYANTKLIAGGEQAGVASANESTLLRLTQANSEYFDKFGFIFIVCATGKSASEMLEILEQRLPNDRPTELANAAAEQKKITKIRLRKLIP